MPTKKLYLPAWEPSKDLELDAHNQIQQDAPVKPLRIQSASQQVANYLREEILRGNLSGTMPGEDRLLGQLGVGRNTIKQALVQLEKEGVLLSQGPGCPRRISMEARATDSTLTIAILGFDESDKLDRDRIELFHVLTEAGHRPFNTPKTLAELGSDVRRVARFVRQTEADAWVVVSAPREVNEWFAEQNIPAFAQFGVQSGIPIAGAAPRHGPTLCLVVRRLVELGHRRIVSLSGSGSHADGPKLTEAVILNEIEAHGIPTGPYNLPCWEDTREGFRKCLESLFRHTPPSALIIEESRHFSATLMFSAEQRLRVPLDVSLICCECPHSFSLAEPTAAYIHWDYLPLVRRIARWADNVAQGKSDHRQSRIKTTFIEGGTIGPAPAASSR